MNSMVVLIAVVACLAQSAFTGYAGVYPGAYGHGALLAGGAYGAGVGAGAAYHGPLARPVVLPSGYLADTPEVAAAKGAHIAALSKSSAVAVATGAGAYGAGAGAGAYGDGSDDHLWAADGSYTTVGAGVGAYGAGAYGAGAYGAGAYGAGAYGAGAYGAGAYGAGAYGAGAYGAGVGAGHRYAGPLAVPVVLPSGYLADTHDVAAAKGAHLTAVANAASRSASYGGAYGAYGAHSAYGAQGAGYYGHGYH